MRNLIDKLMLLESNGDNIPKIAKYFRISGGKLYYEHIELFPKKVIGNDLANLLGREYKITEFMVILEIEVNEHDVIEFREFGDGVRVRVWVDPVFKTDAILSDSDYQILSTIVNRIFKSMGFNENVIDVADKTHFKIDKNDNKSVAYRDKLEKLLSILNAAYQWRQETIGDL